jgi:arabinogalactan endo-1,4-beta-galactosidase
LQATVQTYTTNTVLTLKSEGVMPDFVQLGNETTGGMLWPTGQLNFSGTLAPASDSANRFIAASSAARSSGVGTVTGSIGVPGA